MTTKSLITTVSFFKVRLKKKQQQRSRVFWLIFSIHGKKAL